MLSELRTMWEVLKHTFTKAETVEYPEQMPYLAPRYRGRIGPLYTSPIPRDRTKFRMPSSA